MLIDFSFVPATEIPHFQGGDKSFAAQIAMPAPVKILRGSLGFGASIGMHEHTDNSEVMYVISGEGTAVCDGVEEFLRAGCAHYCPKGHAHSLRNTGDEELVFFAVIQ